MKDYIEKSFAESCGVKEASILAHSDNLIKSAGIMRDCLKAGKKLLVFGNGGSAGDAQHIAAEFVIRLKENRKAYPAIALTTDSSVLTACGNDLGFDLVFARQIEALGQEGDVLIAISTSGNSPNAVKALEEAKKRKLVVLGFTGEGGGKMAPMCDVLVDVKSKNTMRIQETHIFFFHMLCDAVEKMLAGADI